MAFVSGPISFKRFFVDGSRRERVDDALLGRLASQATGADSVRSADHTEIGWTSGEHILDTEFDFGKNVFADGLHFALRIDTNKAPAELVRSYERMSAEAMLEASGREFPSKAQRREAREQALARAEAEARSGAFRRMKQVPVFWDLKRGEVYLGGTGTTVVEAFMLLFRKTFDRPVVAASAGEVAGRWAARVGETRAFDNCRPAHFINPPGGAEAPDDGFSTDQGRARDFLGTEWLTWLWYSSHVESPEVTTPQGDSVTVLFEKLLQLECAFRISGTVAIRTEGPTRLPEAALALAGGKRPIRAGLQIATHGDAFSLVIRGDTMHFSSVRLPPVEQAGNPRELFEERIDRIRDLIETVFGLYCGFLKRRLSGKWPRTLNAMRNWIAAGRHAGARTAGEESASLEAAS